MDRIQFQDGAVFWSNNRFFDLFILFGFSNAYLKSTGFMLKQWDLKGNYHV